MRKLIFDSAITGHHTEYINHLINYIIDFKLDDEDEFTFVVNYEFSKKFPCIYENAMRIKNCEWKQITKKEFENSRNTNRLSADVHELSLVRKYAQHFKADHVYILNLNAIMYATAFMKMNFTFSGILFFHFCRLQKDTFRQKIEYYKRFFLIKFLQSKRKTKSVFILNDQEAILKLNSVFKTNVFKRLADPIPEIKPLENFNIRNHYKIDPERKILLHIGALGKRKGTAQIIKAVKSLNKNARKKITLLLVGKAASIAEKEEINYELNSKNIDNLEQLIWDEQFVPIKMMKSLFMQCDVVMMPYNNVEFSSGILGHAAAANKPVIATGVGLIKILVEKYQLGILIDSSNSQNIATAIEKSFDLNFELGKAQEFVNNHTPEKFSKLILEN